MAAQVQIQSVDASGQVIYATFVIVLSGNYPTGGDLLNFTSGGVLPATQDPAFIGMLAGIESSNCINIDVWSNGGGSVAGGNTVNYSCSRTIVNNVCNPASGIKLKTGVLNTYGTEHSAAAYESAYLNDIIVGMAVFLHLI
jgi:hypothetical protein